MNEVNKVLVTITSPWMSHVGISSRTFTMTEREANTLISCMGRDLTQEELQDERLADRIQVSVKDAETP